MHELKIAEELIDIISKVTEKEKLQKVTRINIQFGKMIMIVPDVFRFVFESAVRDSILKDARLNIEVLPVKFACKKCKEENEIDELIFVCPYCGSSDLELIQGREIFVESIEGEEKIAEQVANKKIPKKLKASFG